MNEQFFSVFDSKAKLFMEPFAARTVEVAVREFRRAVNTQGHSFARFPEDYTLFHVGEFDKSSGKFKAIEPHSLGVAVTFVDPELASRLDLEVGHGS